MLQRIVPLHFRFRWKNNEFLRKATLVLAQKMFLPEMNLQIIIIFVVLVLTRILSLAYMTGIMFGRHMGVKFIIPIKRCPAEFT